MISEILDKINPSRVEKREKRKDIIKQIKAKKEGIQQIEALISRLDEPHKDGLPHALMIMAAKRQIELLEWELENLI